MYQIKKFEGCDILVHEPTQLVVAIASKNHRHIVRACSMEELAKHFIITPDSTVTYFGNASKAFIQDGILVAECIYTKRTVKLSCEASLYNLASAAVLTTWKLAKRISDFNTVNRDEQLKLKQLGTNLFVTYAGRSDALQENITALALIKESIDSKEELERFYVNITSHEDPLTVEDMTNLLVCLALVKHPFEVTFAKTEEMQNKVLAFFRTVHQHSILTMAEEFISKCGTSNQLPITSGDAEYIPAN